jgi:hypothetical protein
MANIDWVDLSRLFIISLALPALAGWLSSDLRVAQMQKKRDHYLELVKSFENWSDDLHVYAPMGVPNPTSNEFEPVKQKNLPDLEYYPQFVDHMESGYTDLWAKWEKLNSGIIEHNIAHAKLLNDIVANLRLIAEKYNTSAIFPYYEKMRPRSYISVDKLATKVFGETKLRLERYPDWYVTGPKYKNKSIYPDGVEVHWWESWGEDIILHENREDAEKIINEFKALVDDGVFQERIYSMIANEKKWGKEGAEFKDLIQRESEKILLGNDMKGKCTICKQFSILSRIFS